MASHKAISVADLPADHLIWLRSLPIHYNDGQRFFVHAGIRPGIPLNKQLYGRKLDERVDVCRGDLTSA